MYVENQEANAGRSRRGGSENAGNYRRERNKHGSRLSAIRPVPFLVRPKPEPSLPPHLPHLLIPGGEPLTQLRHLQPQRMVLVPPLSEGPGQRWEWWEVGALVGRQGRVLKIAHSGYRKIPERINSTQAA